MKALPTDLQAARLRLALSHPYLGSVLWSLTPVERPGLGTLGVDQWGRLYYDTEALGKWTPTQREAVLCHEVHHILRDHAGRLHPRAPDPSLANIAGDLEINDDLRTERLDLPEGCLYPEVYGFPANLTGEEYLERLSQEPPPPPQGGAKGKDRSADRPAPGSAPGPSEAPPSPGPKGKGATPGGELGTGTCGSGATGTHESWEEGPPGTVGPDGEPTPDGMGPAELGTIRQATAEAVRAEASKSRGTVPAGLARWAESYLSPKVDWRKALRSAVRTAVARASGMDDYSFHRPARRPVPGVVLPALYRPIPTVAVVVDTSGSMGTEELEKAQAEIGGVLKTLGTPIEVLSVDAAVHNRQRITRRTQVQLVGGGGTDMGVGLEALTAHRRAPDVIVVITDGYTPWPEKPPARVLTVVCLVGGGPTPPAWARTVKVE